MNWEFLFVTSEACCQLTNVSLNQRIECYFKAWITCSLKKCRHVRSQTLAGQLSPRSQNFSKTTLPTDGGEKALWIYLQSLCLCLVLCFFCSQSHRRRFFLLILSSNDSHWPGPINRFQLADSEAWITQRALLWKMVWFLIIRFKLWKSDKSFCIQYSLPDVIFFYIF